MYIHLLYLGVCHGFQISHLTPKRYLQAEGILREAAADYNLELNVSDVIVWGAVKAVKRAKRNV
jgi:thermostable 8-oxoguanine DNA glycosylase